jgi:hypothetical protein
MVDHRFDRAVGSGARRIADVMAFNIFRGIINAINFQKAVIELSRFRHSPGIATSWNAWIEKNHNGPTTHGQYAAVEAAVRGTAWKVTETLLLVPADENKVRRNGEHWVHPLGDESRV